MSLRAKTKRRLIVLLVASVAIAASLGGYVALRVGQLRARARHAGDIGMAYAKSNDYENALPNLGQYLGRFPDDPDALYYCGIAREKIDPRFSTLVEATQYYRRAIQLCPPGGAWLTDARRRLLKLYVRIGYNAEAIGAAGALHDALPKDRDALYYKAYAQLQQQNRDALDTIRQCNDLYPLDFESHFLELQIRNSTGAKIEDLVDVANGFVKAHPEDAGLQVLQSIIYSAAGNEQSAKSAALSAAERDIPDPKSLSLLINELDKLDLLPQAQASAIKAAEKHSQDVEFQRVLAERLLVAQDYRQFDDRWGNLDPAKLASDEQLLALKGLSLFFRGEKDQAKALFNSLNNRSKNTADSLARAIAEAIEALGFEQDDREQQDLKLDDHQKDELNRRVETCKKALIADSQNAFLHFILGELYLKQQNLDLAIQQWNAAKDAAPAWSLPWKRMARVQLDARQYGDALKTARRADLRQPNDQEINVMLAAAMAGTTDPRKADQTAALLDFLQATRSKFPAAEELRPYVANLHALMGQKDQAIEEVRAAFALSPPASENTLMSLELISYRYHLGLEEECFRQSEEAHGLTPPLAYAKAVWLSVNARGAEALKLLEDRATQKDASVLWRLMYARYLELTNDPKAKACWMALAEEFAQNTDVQWAAFEAASMQREYKFLEDTLKRLLKQLGEDNVEGRMAKALLLLQKDPTEKQLTEASLILSDVTRTAPALIQAHMLLANCLQRLNNVSGALEQLRIAQTMRPDDISIALRMAPLLMNLGDSAGAREQLARLSQSQYPSSLAQKEQAASLYVAMGSQDQAAQLLQNENDSNASLMLAQIHMQKGEFNKAEAICSRLFQSPSAAVIAVYATCLASEGKKTEAEAVLAKLDTVDANPGIRELIRAEYFSRFGKPEDALAQYVAATKAAPTEFKTWRGLVALCIRIGRIEEAVGYLTEGRKAIHDAGLDALGGLISQLRQLGPDGDRRDLFIAILQSPDDVPVLTEAINLASAANRKTLPLPTLAQQAKDLADKNTKVFAVQLLAIKFCDAVGRFDDSAAITARTSADFPNSAEIARAATQSLANAQRWNEAIAAANQWRQRDPASAMQADALIALAYFRLRNYDAVIRQLDPYLERVKAAPDDYASMILMYSQAMLATRQTDRAAKLMEPLLTSSEWRMRWISLVGGVPEAINRVRWMDRVAAAIPPDATAERIQLAVGYAQVGELNHDPSLEKKARSIFEPIAANPSIEPTTLYTIGVLYEALKDLPNAEKTYERVLIAAPNHAGALNNIAMILSNADRDLPKALSYAQRAIKTSPPGALPSCYDTECNVYIHMKSYDKALESNAEALKLTPADIELQATRVWLLALSSKRDQADKEFKDMQSAGALGRLSDSSRVRLADVGLK